MAKQWRKILASGSSAEIKSFRTDISASVGSSLSVTTHISSSIVHVTNRTYSNKITGSQVVFGTSPTTIQKVTGSLRVSGSTIQLKATHIGITGSIGALGNSQARFSGSFSGSFRGDGSQLIGVVACPAGTACSVQLTDGALTTATDCFKFDYTNNRLGINEPTPQVFLHVSGSGSYSNFACFDGINQATNMVHKYLTGASNCIDLSFGDNTSTPGVLRFNNSTNRLCFGVDSGLVSINDQGHVSASAYTGSRLLVGNVSSSCLTGTGHRIVTSNPGGALGNGTSIAGNNTFSGTTTFTGVAINCNTMCLRSSTACVVSGLTTAFFQNIVASGSCRLDIYQFVSGTGGSCMGLSRAGGPSVIQSGQNFGIGTTAARILTFSTNNTRRVTVDSSGFVSSSCLAGTGHRIVTSNAAGALGNSTSIAGNYNYSGQITGSSLRVNGNITVTGTVDGRDVAGDGSTLDSITGTQYWSIPGIAFDAVNPDTDQVKKQGATINSSALTIEADGVTINAPVTLPHGATITSIIVEGSISDETWTLTRTLQGTTTRATMATANINTADTSITAPTVDNNNYVYHLETSSLDTNDVIYSAKVTYTI